MTVILTKLKVCWTWKVATKFPKFQRNRDNCRQVRLGQLSTTRKTISTLIKSAILAVVERQSNIRDTRQINDPRQNRPDPPTKWIQLLTIDRSGVDQIVHKMGLYQLRWDLAQFLIRTRLLLLLWLLDQTTNSSPLTSQSWGTLSWRLLLLSRNRTPKLQTNQFGFQVKITRISTI